MSVEPYFDPEFGAPALSSSQRRSLDWTNKWYFNRIPYPISGRKFLEFVLGNQELLNEVKSGLKLQFDGSIKAPCTDGETVWLPSYLLDFRYYDWHGIPDGDIESAAITVINGVQIHEAQHAVMSPCKMGEFLEKNVPADRIKEHGQLIASAFNLLEDLYIENRAHVDRRKISPFITGLNEVTFGPWIRERVKQTINSEKEPLTRTKFLESMVLLKNRDHVNEYLQEEWAPWKSYQELMYSVLKLDSQSSRLQLAIKLVDEIIADPRLLPEPEAESGMPQNGPSGPDEKENSSGGGGLGQALVDALGDLFAGLTEQQIEALEADMESGGAAEHLAQLANQILSEMEEHDRIFNIFKQKSIEPSDINPVIFKDVLDVGGGSEKLEPNRSWLQLGQFIRYARSINHTPGRMRDEGSDVSAENLFRIATDSQFLFNKDGKSMRRGAPELILLIDASGSMRGRYGFGRSLMQVVSEAALGAFMSMVEARLPCAVYAHTTTNGPKGEHSHVVAVAAYQMPLLSKRLSVTGDTKTRFGKLMGVDSNNNLDGVALEYVGHRFTSQPGSKLVAVLSDGRPAGHIYGGEAAMNHTARVAVGLRKQGIGVMSFSLVESVVRENDRIYGEKYNMRAYGEKLTPALRQIVQELSKLGRQN